jgi:hypothetical protein
MSVIATHNLLWPDDHSAAPDNCGRAATSAVGAAHRMRQRIWQHQLNQTLILMRQRLKRMAEPLLSSECLFQFV